MRISSKLEKFVENLKDNGKKKSLSLYLYGVDVGSGLTYYTPMYAGQELISGKDIDTVINTRLLGIIGLGIGLRPVGKLRNYFAKRWNVNKDSSFLEKLKLNAAAILPIQAGVYGSMLIGGMAISDNWEWAATGTAYGLGMSVAAFHTFPFGWFQDKFRKVMGVKPAVRGKEMIPELAK